MITYYIARLGLMTMIKTTFPFAGPNVQIARLVDIHSRGVDHDWLVKRAAVLTKEIDDIQPEKDYTYIHLISMGAGERYGGNRNGDIFYAKNAKVEFPEPEAGGRSIKTVGPGLIDCHKTFKKYAHVFRDHNNKAEDEKIGDVVAEAFNHDMQRGELIVKVNNNKFADGIEKLACGEDTPWSMSCRVSHDVCSICGHEAPNRKEYCNHLKNELTQVKSGGHQVNAINPNPIFFDISYVFRPADRIAYGLRKVASTGGMPEEFIPSAQLAEMWGISAPKSVLWDSSPRPVQEKLAAMERLAAMEKQIEATGHAISPEIDAAVPEGSIPDDVSSQLRGLDFNEMMGALAQAKICLPIKDFFRLILGNKYDSVAGDMDSAESILPGIFGRMLKSSDGVEDVTGLKTYDPAMSLLPKRMRDALGDLEPDMSLGETPVGRRVQITIIRGGPGMKPKEAHVKSASSNKVAEYLAKQYVAYQLAFSRMLEGGDGRIAEGLMIRRNYA